MFVQTRVRSIVAFIILTLFTIVPLQVGAQITDDMQPVAYVDRVDVNEMPATQGGAITGTFTVSNGGSVPIDNIQYNISLTGAYEQGLPTEFYDTVQSEQVFDLAVGEMRSIPFSYVLPKTIAGDGMAIEVELFLSTGASLGWNHAPLSITGTNVYAKLLDARLKKGDETYVLDFGPTFLADDQPQLTFTLKGAGNTVQHLTPRAVFSTYQNRDTVLQEETYDTITLSAKEEVTTVLDLPTFGRKAGVYYGVLRLENEQGELAAPAMSFQYIMDGDIATIHSVSFDETFIKSGGSVRVAVRMTGKPFAQEVVTDALESTLDGYTFALTLKNEKGDTVATYAEDLDSFNETEPKYVTLQAQDDVQYPIAEVQLKKGDVIVASYTTEVPDWVLVSKPVEMSALLITLYGLLLMALITLGMLFIIKRDGRVLVSIFAVIIVALIIAVYVATYMPAIVRAAGQIVSFTQVDTATGSCRNSRGNSQGCGRVGRVWSLIPGVTINRPDSVNADGTVTLTGNMTFDSCGNSANSRHIWQIGTDGSLTELHNLDVSAMGKRNFDSRGHWFDGTKRYSITPTVAESCGVQTINLRFVNCVAGECGMRQKQVTLDLGPCDLCPNVEGNQREIPGGYRLDETTGQCMLTDDFQVLCSPSQNPVAPGSDVTFTASTFNAQGNVEFTWYAGRNGSGDVIKNETSATRSRITRQFNTTGMYQVSVRGRDERGVSFTRTCGVMVRDPNADPDELVDTDGDGIPDTAARDLSALPTAPAPVLSLEIDRTLTNNICTLTWSAQHVTQCFLVAASGTTEAVSVTGTKPVEPNTYFLRCLALRDGSVAETDPVTCRLNPGIREI